MYYQRYGNLNKYRNVRQTYNGYSYHSKAEAQQAFELDMRLKANEFKSWERQVKIPLYVNGYWIANYRVDFAIHHHDGSIEYVEVKGMETEEWKIKWRLTEALLHEDIKKEKVKLTIIKVGNNYYQKWNYKKNILKKR